MAKLIAIYKTPTDISAFERHYFETHIPLAKKMPGFKRYEVSQRPVTTVAGPEDVFLIGMVHFETMEDLQRAFDSPEGRACAADRRIFAPNDSGVLIFTADFVEV